MAAKILIACEESQAVCIEFRKLGFEAYSCDILPCSGGHPEWHFQEDVFEALKREKWDMVIAFPPCTDLAVSGARHFKKKKEDGRQQKSIEFFMKFTTLDVPYVAIENPIGIMSTLYRKPDQIVQPFYFGDPDRKTTCLWLKGLPELEYTNVVVPNIIKTQNGNNLSQWHYDSYKLPNIEQGKMRSKTFPGVAKAIASQWGKILNVNS